MAKSRKIEYYDNDDYFDDEERDKERDKERRDRAKKKKQERDTAWRQWNEVDDRG